MSAHRASGESTALLGLLANGRRRLGVRTLIDDVDSGAISWDGRDLRTCDPDDLRTQIAVIFQDFVHYEVLVGGVVGDE